MHLLLAICRCYTALLFAAAYALAGGRGGKIGRRRGGSTKG